MKKQFIHDDFLLNSPQARRLYHEYAEGLPIIDYHSHLPADQIAGNKTWENLAQIWLASDHYKWRAMRANGVQERYCTGKASEREKFEKWAACMPCMVRHPMHHWTHLELARYFGIHELLSPSTAEKIWNKTRRQLQEPRFSCRELMKRSNVRLVCTTDDPVDSLEHHRAVARDSSFSIKVLPTWRPDKAMAVDKPELFNRWVNALAVAADTDIRDFDSFMQAIRRRHDFFHKAGCRLSDHDMTTPWAVDYTERDLRSIFRQARGGKTLAPDLVTKFKSGMLVEFAQMDHAKNWTQQFHVGVLRNNSSRLMAAFGPDAGGDSIGDCELGRPLSRFLDRLDSSGRLARTIMYAINPADAPLLITMMGSFQDGSMPGKMQAGLGWWFMDQNDGIAQQLKQLSVMGVLSRYVGMTTDSRSFLSFTRHEYFRRVVCNMLGRDMEKGTVPNDMELMGGIVKAICHGNAASYFGFHLSGC